MRLSSRFAILMLGSLSLTTLAYGQVGLATEIVTSTQPLSSEQHAQVQSYVDYWADKLAQGDLQSMVEARNELITSAYKRGGTTLFLQAYSVTLLPSLTELSESEDSIRAENALRVAAFLRTPNATGLIISKAHKRNNDDATTRLVAAGLLSIAVADVRESGLNSAELTTTARGISDAIEDESDWHVVLQDLRALSAIAASSSLSGTNRGVVRELQFASFANLVNRVSASDEPSDLVKAIYRAMLDLRMRLIASGTGANSESRAVAGSLRTSLSKIGAASIKQWTGLTKDAPARHAYEGTLRVGAQLLSLLDGKPDSNAAALAKAMGRGKKDLQTALARFSDR